jgi:hypothetical protein
VCCPDTYDGHPARARTVFQAYRGDSLVVHAHHLLALSRSLALADFLILQSHAPFYLICHLCRSQPRSTLPGDQKHSYHSLEHPGSVTMCRYLIDKTRLWRIKTLALLSMRLHTSEALTLPSQLRKFNPMHPGFLCIFCGRKEPFKSVKALNAHHQSCPRYWERRRSPGSPKRALGSLPLEQRKRGRLDEQESRDDDRGEGPSRLQQSGQSADDLESLHMACLTPLQQNVSDLITEPRQQPLWCRRVANTCGTRAFCTLWPYNTDPSTPDGLRTPW